MNFHIFTANAQKCFMKLLFVLMKSESDGKEPIFANPSGSSKVHREKLGKVKVFF